MLTRQPRRTCFEWLWVCYSLSSSRYSPAHSPPYRAISLKRWAISLEVVRYSLCMNLSTSTTSSLCLPNRYSMTHRPAMKSTNSSVTTTRSATQRVVLLLLLLAMVLTIESMQVLKGGYICWQLVSEACRLVLLLLRRNWLMSRFMVLSCCRMLGPAVSVKACWLIEQISWLRVLIWASCSRSSVPASRPRASCDTSGSEPSRIAPCSRWQSPPTQLRPVELAEARLAKLANRAALAPQTSTPITASSPTAVFSHNGRLARCFWRFSTNDSYCRAGRFSSRCRGREGQSRSSSKLDLQSILSRKKRISVMLSPQLKKTLLRCSVMRGSAEEVGKEVILASQLKWNEKSIGCSSLGFISSCKAFLAPPLPSSSTSSSFSGRTDDLADIRSQKLESAAALSGMNLSPRRTLQRPSRSSSATSPASRGLPVWTGRNWQQRASSEIPATLPCSDTSSQARWVSIGCASIRMQRVCQEWLRLTFQEQGTTQPFFECSQARSMRSGCLSSVCTPRHFLASAASTASSQSGTTSPRPSRFPPASLSMALLSRVTSPTPSSVRDSKSSAPDYYYTADSAPASNCWKQVVEHSERQRRTRPLALGQRVQPLGLGRMQSYSLAMQCSARSSTRCCSMRSRMSSRYSLWLRSTQLSRCCLTSCICFFSSYSLYTYSTDRSASILRSSRRWRGRCSWRRQQTRGSGRQRCSSRSLSSLEWRASLPSTSMMKSSTASHFTPRVSFGREPKSWRVRLWVDCSASCNRKLSIASSLRCLSSILTQTKQRAAVCSSASWMWWRGARRAGSVRRKGLASSSAARARRVTETKTYSWQLMFSSWLKSSSSCRKRFTWSSRRKMRQVCRKQNSSPLSSSSTVRPTPIARKTGSLFQWSFGLWKQLWPRSKRQMAVCLRAVRVRPRRESKWYSRCSFPNAQTPAASNSQATATPSSHTVSHPPLSTCPTTASLPRAKKSGRGVSTKRRARTRRAMKKGSRDWRGRVQPLKMELLTDHRIRQSKAQCDTTAAFSACDRKRDSTPTHSTAHSTNREHRLRFSSLPFSIFKLLHSSQAIQINKRSQGNIRADVP